MASQQGAVLLFAIIALVATTLAGIALTRSVDTGNALAGNLAFYQAATQVADVGSESAIEWLSANIGPTLENDAYANGYASNGYASTQNPTLTETWDHLWTNTFNRSTNPQIARVTFDCTTHLPNSAGTCYEDAYGNSVSFAIQRLCTASGTPGNIGVTCSLPPATSIGGSKSALGVAYQYSSQLYYRITVRIDGPRRTVNYIQTIVAL
jgi:type IV pilus assembly protein PilX